MSSKLDVLMIDDSGADVLLVERELKAGGMNPKITHIYSQEDLEKALRKPKPDIILVDNSGILFDAKTMLADNNWGFISLSGHEGTEVHPGTIACANKNRLWTLPSIIRETINEGTIMNLSKHIETQFSRIDQKLDLILSKIQN